MCNGITAWPGVNVNRLDGHRTEQTIVLMDQTKTTIGPDGLVEYGQYLVSLHGYAGYSFEVEQGGHHVTKTLDEIIELYRAFIASTDERFKLLITFRAGDILTSTTREFRRLKS